MDEVGWIIKDLKTLNREDIKEGRNPPANGSVSMEGYVAVGEVVEEDAQAPGSSR